MSSNEQLPFFVYGTLRPNQAAYHFLAGHTQSEYPAVLSGFKLYSMGSYPIILPATPEDKIIGEVITVTPSCYDSRMRALDDWEDYDPNEPDAGAYRREIQPVLRGDGVRVSAWCYVGIPAHVSAYLPLIGSGDWSLATMQMESL